MIPSGGLIRAATDAQPHAIQEDSMFKSTAISAIFAAAALQASAEPGSEYDLSILPADVAARVTVLQQYGDRFRPAIQATLNEWNKPPYTGGEAELDLSVLPADVAAGVVKMQEYGDRFDDAIRGVFIEAMKPASGFCNGNSQVSEVAHTVPES